MDGLEGWGCGIFADCCCGWYWKLLGFGAFAYCCGGGGGCVIMKVFVASDDCDARSDCECEEDRKGGDE